jgi:hypothetical protein
MFSATLDSAIVKLIFNGTAIANLADNAASSPLTNLYLSLHTADPTGGTQATSEASYTGYARVAIVRTSAGWTVAGTTVSPTAQINFPPGTGGGGTATYGGIGTAATGAGELLCSGTVTPNIVMGATVTPFLGTGSTITLN